MRHDGAPALGSYDPGRAGSALGAAALIGAGVLAVSGGVAWHQAFVLLVLAPLLEESVFRAGVQEWLMRSAATPFAASLVTALLFALAHVIARADWTQIVLAVPALLIGAVYARTRRLRHCVALHAAMNALWLLWAVGR